MTRFLLAALLFVFLTVPALTSRGGEPRMTGLAPATKAELDWQNKNMIRVKKVKLNKIGLARVNAARKKKGLGKLSAKPTRLGKEVEGTVGGVVPAATPEEGTSEAPAADLPGYLDNSQLKYFPPIRSQGSLPSCACFSGTYYTMTHMWALANDLDAKAGGDALRLSPKFTYNLVNGGAAVGSWYYWAYDVGKKHGVATWAEFPYDSNYRAWPTDKATYRSAINKRFDSYGYVSGTDTAAGMDQVKQLLVNGYILNIPTYVYSWQYRNIGNDPATTEDDAFVGKSACFWVNGTSGYHAMTVVGYNDHIWVDINGNGTVDSGEKGAFRIANSWGTGWGEAGYGWMAYDALKAVSAVSGGPSASRGPGWNPTRAHWVTARTAYQPSVVAEFTVNHLKRNQLGMSLGISDTSQSTPASNWYPYKLTYYAGGAYAFNGGTTAIDGTFYLDFTDLAPTTTKAQRWYVTMRDSAAGDVATLKSFKLYQVSGGSDQLVGTATNVPQTADGGETKYAWVDYTYNSGNVAPTAVMTATPTSGVEPLTVSFNGSGSSDPDGTLVSWAWNFGDGAGASGQTASHTYTSAGNYIATLTVTDDKGGTSETTEAIAVNPDPNRTCHVASIDMAIGKVPGGIQATATVRIVKKDGSAGVGAVVGGIWNGPKGGTSSGTTGSDGKVTLNSPKAKDKGEVTFSFTVTNVTLSGWTYDSGQNLETTDSVTYGTVTNKAPTAVAGATPTSGGAPLVVAFSGMASSDSDGTISSYQWSFGDGGSATGMTPSHTYTAEGSYEARLTVTDDKGATGSDTVTILVTGDPAQVVHVASITMSVATVPGGKAVQARVKVVNASGAAVAGLTVSGQFGGVLKSSSTNATTGADGVALLTSLKTKASGSATFTVTGVAGAPYDPAANVESSDSITLP
jgi:PKD repeat protein/C1A family cysteine protease